MATDDDLRARLTEALSEFEVFKGVDGCPSIRMKDPWTDKERVDALMPVIREALAQAWDEGHIDACGDCGELADRNPWRTPSTATPSSTELPRTAK